MKKDGFTLIEMVAVIAIIGILAAALGPSVYSLFTTSKVTVLQNDIKTIESALFQLNASIGSYPADNDPPPNGLCGEEPDPDLIGDFRIENDEEEENNEEHEDLDDGILYNRFGKPFVDQVPQKSITGGSFRYRVGAIDDFYHENRDDIALIITVCSGTSGHETIFRDLDKKIDHGDGALSGYIQNDGAANKDDWSGNLVVVLFGGDTL